MDLSVVVAAREGEDGPKEAMVIAAHADDLRFKEVWVGEGPTWDSFALATAIGLATDTVEVTVGPVPVSVRDPATISRGAASVAALTGRTVGIALGTSSTRVVEGVHGRSRAGAAATLAATARAVRALMEPRPGPGDRAGAGGLRSHLPPPTGPLTVAAFGDRAIAVAADHADRMLLDLVSPEQVAKLREKLEKASANVRRTPPRLAAWLPAAVEPDDESRRQIMHSIVGYLTVPGYREMFVAAGFGEAVARAEGGAGGDEMVTALPADAPEVVGLVGSVADVKERLDTYAAAGLDELAIVPATAGDPGGQRTLTAMRGLASQPGVTVDP